MHVAQGKDAGRNVSVLWFSTLGQDQLNVSLAKPFAFLRGALVKAARMHTFEKPLVCNKLHPKLTAVSRCS